MVEALIVTACYSAFWSSLGGLGEVTRPLIFVLLMLAALIAIADKRLKPIGATPTELLLYAVGLLSSIVALLRSTDYSIYYSMYFITAILCLSVIGRTISTERLLDLGAVVALLCIVTSLVFDWKGLLMGLSVSIGPQGMMRFAPLGNHPLLTGYIVGSGSILLIRRAYITRRSLERYVMICGTLTAWAMVLAASARSTVVALVAASLFAIVVEFRLVGSASPKRLGLIAVVLAAAVILYLATGSTYLQDVLQVDSATRGIGTGATGRTDLWQEGIDALTATPSMVMFGGGLRSSEYMVIGFSTENSYITIVLDSGIFLGTALIVFLLHAPVSALRQIRSSPGERHPLSFMPTFFVFLLVQCFFIRYLVGLGNPTALITLLLLVSLSMRVGFQRSLGRAPNAAPATAPVAGRLRAPGRS